MRNKLLLLLCCLWASITQAQPLHNAKVLGLEKQFYTDSLPHSPTGVYYVAADITLSGNICVENAKFLLKSDFRRNQSFDLQQNKCTTIAGGIAYGTNIQLCNANVTLLNCTMAAADSGMWGGIYLSDGSSVLKLIGCCVADSYNGIIQKDSSLLQVENSTFRNNYVSLQLSGHRDTLRHNSFSSRPSAMKMPLDSVGVTEHFISQTHLKNTEVQELYLSFKQFENNLFGNALVSMSVTEKHKINIENCVFGGSQLASIYHQNGELSISQTDFNLSTVMKKTKLNAALPFRLPNVGQRFGIISEQGKAHLSQVSMYENTAQSIGYYGFDSDVQVQCSEFVGLQNALHLTGQTGKYSLQATRYENNTTGVWIHRQQASNIELPHFEQSVFVSLPDNKGNYPARTGLRLTGAAGTTINNQSDGYSKIGGCNDYINSSLPAGNSIKTVKNVEEPSMYPDNFNFTFIDNQIIDIEGFRYYRYHNESVGNKNIKNNHIIIMNCLTKIEPVLIDCYYTATGSFNDETRPLLQNLLNSPIPNPTDNETQISYTLPKEAIGKAQIVVYAPVSGKAVFSQMLQEAEGSVELHTQRWATGIYPYILLIDGKVIQSRKLAVVR